MRVSSREITLAWTTGLVALAALTYVFCEPRVKEFREILNEQKAVTKKIELDARLASQRQTWQRRLTEVSKGLPEFPADKDVTADLLIILERIARNHGVNLLRRDADKEEKKHSNVYELAITCKYEASLDALVHFLFELQQQGAMLDLSQLSVAPEKGILRGNFTVNCAYRRTSERPAAVPAVPPKEMPRP